MFYLFLCFVPRGKRVRTPFAALPSRGSREFTPPFAALPSRGSREFTPPFAALPSRGSREFTPPFAALSSRRSREFSPPFAAQPSRRSREFTPPFADQPAHRSQEMTTPPSTANPSPPARRWLDARRPASDSMPAGLPLTQCPPACLWLKPAGLPLTQARRIAADSSSPDCRWLMPAGRRWRGKPTLPLSVHAAIRGSPNPPFRGRFTPPSVGKANPPSAAPSGTRGRPTRRPWFTRPAAGCGSLQPAGPCRCVVKPASCCRYCQASRLWSRQPVAAVLTSQPAVAVIDQTVTMVFLITVLVCVFSPGGLQVPLSYPMVFFWGGYKGLGCCGRAEGRGHGHHGPPALASVYLFHSGGPVLCMYPCLSWGASRVPTPPPRWNCYGSGRAFREGGVMLEVFRVCLVFPPLVSLYG